MDYLFIIFCLLFIVFFYVFGVVVGVVDGVVVGVVVGLVFGFVVSLDGVFLLGNIFFKIFDMIFGGFLFVICLYSNEYVCMLSVVVLIFNSYGLKYVYYYLI